MTCWIRARISMTSPRRVSCGRFSRTRAISALHAGGEGHHDLGGVGPEAAVTHPRDGDEALAGGEAHARGDGGASGTRAELDDDDMRLRILLVEQGDGT